MQVPEITRLLRIQRFADRGLSPQILCVAADKNGDGRLSVQEYIDARMIDFEVAERNKDGVLTRDETEGK